MAVLLHGDQLVLQRAVDHRRQQRAVHLSCGEEARVLVGARFPAQFHSHRAHSFALWYCNDAPETVSDTVRVTLRIGEEERTLTTWETGDVPSCTNMEGETICVTLPDVDAEALVLTLESANGNTNEYKLLYRR